MYRTNFGGRLLRRGMCAIFIGDVRHLRPIPSRSRAKMAYIPGGGVFRAAVSCRPCAVQPAVINISVFFTFVIFVTCFTCFYETFAL